MPGDFRSLLWLLSGNALVVSGIAISGLGGFSNNLLYVMLGILFFISGYRIAQFGAETDPDTKEKTNETGYLPRLYRIPLVVIGWLTISYGVTAWTQVVLSPSLTGGVIAGTSSIGGYITAHIGINGAGIGSWTLETNMRKRLAGDARTDQSQQNRPQGTITVRNDHTHKSAFETLTDGLNDANLPLFAVSTVVCMLSLASGSIWACGENCISSPLIWTAENQALLVFIMATTTWGGYLTAHYAITGFVIDTSGNEESQKETETGIWEDPAKRALGMSVGCMVLISGMVWGMIQVRAGNHIQTYLASFLFLSGYMIAHTVDTGRPL